MRWALGRTEPWRLPSPRPWWTALSAASICGPEGSFRYDLREPTTLWRSSPGGRYAAEPVPEEWLKTPGSPRDASEGDPSETFRWDQAWEFVSAIRESRRATPCFADGLAVQSVLDAGLLSSAEGRWVQVAVPTENSNR